MALSELAEWLRSLGVDADAARTRVVSQAALDGERVSSFHTPSVRPPLARPQPLVALRSRGAGRRTHAMLSRAAIPFPIPCM